MIKGFLKAANPGQALAVALDVAGGIRGCEIGIDLNAAGIWARGPLKDG